MMRQTPPNFTGDLRKYARDLSEFLTRLQAAFSQATVSPQLRHKLGSESAAIDGVLMFDPAAERLTVSKNKAWSTVADNTDIDQPKTVKMLNDIAANIPAGWVLCDGTNGTPDMTGTFSGSGLIFIMKT